jgi:hypothetical protein
MRRWNVMICSVVAAHCVDALPAAAQIDVGDPWVRGIVAGQTSTGAYMQIRSATDTRWLALIPAGNRRNPFDADGRRHDEDEGRGACRCQRASWSTESSGSARNADGREATTEGG